MSTAAPLRALHIPNGDKHRETALPGSVWFSAVGEGGSQAMRFFCPCGCGDIFRIEFNSSLRTEQGPVWRWNGRMDAPTLTPSIRQLNCGWHGWLRNGYWEAC